MEKNSSSELSLRSEFDILWRKKKLIFIISFVAGVIAFILSSPPIREPEYKAWATFIPPRLSNIKVLNYHKDIFSLIPVGSREDVERLVEVLNSYDAYLYVKKHFNLKEIYEIKDHEDKLLEDKKIYKAYRKHIEIGITPFEAVSIEVWDKDPYMAAKIAEKLLEYADTFVETIAKRREGLRNVNISIQKLFNIQEDLSDSLHKLRKKYKIYDFRQLSEIATKQAISVSTKDPEGFYKNYDKVVALEKLMGQQNTKLSLLLLEKVFREENLATYPTLLDIIERPHASKTYKRPKRSIVSLVTMIIIGFITSIVILIRDKVKNQ